METVLRTQELQRFFGSHAVVNALNIELKAGTITGLIGPNGAGKTTLMLMLAGMLAPTKGSIEITTSSGEKIDFTTNPRLARAQIGWLPDTFGSWGELKVREIMYYFARLYGIDKNSARSRTAELLELTHLSDMSEKQAHILSRGQKQRLGVARTLLNHPRVLLLDEPAAGMDPRSRIELRDTLRSQADNGVSILISSHVLSELEDTVDNTIFMKAGMKVDISALQENTAGNNQVLRYKLTVLDPAPLHAFLEKHQNVTNITAITTKEFEVHVNNTSQAAKTLAQITAADVAVTSFTPIKHKLEEIYLKVEESRQ